MTFKQLKNALDNLTKDWLTHILIENKGHVTNSAKFAQLDRSNFLRLLRKHNIKSSNFRN